jgi:ribosomal protein S18 acetylase RimI-like enzyme
MMEQQTSLATDPNRIRPMNALVEGGKDVVRGSLNFLNAANEAKARNIEASGNKDLADEIRRQGATDVLYRQLDEKWLKPDGTFKRPEGFKGYVYDVVRMTPQVASQIGVSLAGGPVAGGMFMGTQIAGQTVDNLEKQGVDPERAWKAALANAFSQAPMEQLGIGKALKFWKPGKTASKALRAMVESGGTEFLTEWAQQYPELAARIWAQGEGKDFGKLLDEFTEGFAEATKEGIYQGAVAAPLGAAAGGAGAVSQMQETAEPPIESPEIETKAPVVDEILEKTLNDLVKGEYTVENILEGLDQVPDEYRPSIEAAVNDFESGRINKSDIETKQDAFEFPKQTPQEQDAMEREIIRQRGVPNAQALRKTGEVPGQAVDQTRQRYETTRRTGIVESPEQGGFDVVPSKTIQMPYTPEPQPPAGNLPREVTGEPAQGFPGPGQAQPTPATTEQGAEPVQLTESVEQAPATKIAKNDFINEYRNQYVFPKTKKETGPLYYDDDENAIVYDKDGYRISVNKPGNANRVVLWTDQDVKGRTYKRKIGALQTNEKTKKINGKIGKYLSISEIEIDKEHRGLGLGKQMYRELIKHAPDDIDGIISYTPNRVNKKQVPAIYKRLGAFTDGDYEIIPIKKESPAPSIAATQFNESTPGNDLKFDGEQDRSAINKPPLYGFTPQSGPMRGRSFSVETPTSESVTAKFNEMVAKQSEFDKERPFRKRAPERKPIQESSVERTEAVGRTRPQETPGSAWIGDQRRPFINPRHIKRGKNKGKYYVQLTAGRDADGNIKPGKRRMVDEKDIVSWPEEAATKPATEKVESKEKQEDKLATEDKPDTNQNKNLSTKTEYKPVDTKSKNFKRWFKKSLVADSNGEPLVVYHATTHDIDAFNRDKANIENDMGAGFYFTNTEEDASVNYAGEGPDLTARIERRAEQLEYEISEDPESFGFEDIDEIDIEEEAKKIARSELSGGAPNIIPAYLSFQNPVIIGGRDETVFTYEYTRNEDDMVDFRNDAWEEIKEDQELEDSDRDDYSDEIEQRAEEIYDENGYDTEEVGTLVDFIESLKNAASYYDDSDPGMVVSDVMEAANYESITASELIDALKKSEGIVYAADYDNGGDMASSEIIRRAFEGAGFDGIIDNTVDVKFGSQRRVGKQMEGMNYDTVHYIAFKPEQIKSAISNTGEFSETDPRIRQSTKTEGPGITPRQVVKAFKSKGMDTEQVGNLVRVKTPSKYIYIDVAESVVDKNEVAIQMGYGRSAELGEKVAGSFENLDGMSLIKLKRSLADQGTLEHELWHFIKKAGVLKPLELRAIERAAGKDEEEQARWIESKLRDRAQNKGIVKRAIQSIADFIDALISVFHATQRSILRGAESGKFLKRESYLGEVVGEELSTRDQTESEAFKKWFGDSKVVDDDGAPLVVYHGTDRVFDRFDFEKTGDKTGASSAKSLGFFFSGKMVSNLFGGAQIYGRYSEGSNTVPAYLSIQNPMHISATDFQEYLFGENARNEKIDALVEDISEDYGDKLYIENDYPHYQSNKDGQLYPIEEEKLSDEAMEYLEELTDVLGQDIRDSELDWGLDKEGWRTLKQEAIELGHDGIVIDSEDYNPGQYNIIRAEELEEDNYIAFYPEQIKSATGNIGTFDPTNPDIRYSTKTPINPFLENFKNNINAIKEKKSDDPSLKESPEPETSKRIWDEFIYQAQDKFNYLNKAQMRAARKKGSDLPEYMDAYLAELRYHGMVGAEIDDSENDHVSPLIDLMSKNGIDSEMAGEYLVARHAKEANAQLKKMNITKDEVEQQRSELVDRLEKIKSDRANIRKAKPDKYPIDKRYKQTEKAMMATHAAIARLDNYTPVEDNTALSGMTDERADEILSEASMSKNARVLDEIGRRVDAITQAQRDLLRKSGLEKDETIDAWEAVYRHYVPLFREGKDASLPKKGRGFDTRGGQKRRAGSTREIDFGRILPQIVSQYQTTIVRSEKAKVGRAFLEFAKANEGPWKVDQVEYAPSFNSDGLVVYRPDPQDRLMDNVMAVRINGEEHHITFDEGDPEAMRIVSALKNLDAETNGILVKSLSKVTRWLAMVNTGLNPEFIITNFGRDIQTAIYNMNDSEAHDIKMKALKDVPAALKGIYQGRRKGIKDTEWGSWYERFRKAGGQTGWVESYSDINARRRSLERQIRRMKPDNFHTTLRGMKAVGDWVNDMNTVVENGIRLSVFKNLVEKGATEAKAARVAKELTVNFNRKGNMGPAINAWKLFYNASIQGTARVLMATKNQKVRRRFIYPTIAFAWALDAINRSVGGDDEDGEPYYDKIPDWVKDRKLIVMLPKQIGGGEGEYFSLPLPWGYNVLHVIGQTLGELTTKKNFKPVDGGLRLARATIDAFNPVGNDISFLQTLAPAPLIPIVQVVENKDWTGKRIHPENDIYNPKPMSELYWSSVREPSRDVARLLNQIGGGNEAKVGVEWLDISPESIDHVVDAVGGGMAKFFARSASAARKYSKGEDIESYEIPFVRQVFGKPGASTLSSDFYDNIDTVRVAERQYKHYEDDKEMIKKIIKDNKSELRLGELARDASKEVSELRRQRSELERRGETPKSSDRIRRIDNRIERIMRRFNKKFNARDK